MKLIDNLTGKLYNKVFGIRSDIRPGIHYFDETHFKGLIKEDFSFNNDNDVTLRGGFYHYKTFDKDTLVVFNHGIGGGHQAYMKEIDYLARNGFKVLAIDYMGCVNSDGDSMGGLTQPILDVSKAIELVKKDYKNIYVVGHSWGGFVTQGVSSIHKEIKKVVLLAGLNSLESMLDASLPFPLSLLKKSVLRNEFNKYGEVSKLSAKDSLNRNDLSALVIQSKDDNILKPKFNIDLIKENCINKNVEFVYVDGKLHNPEYTKDAVNKLNAYLNRLNKIKDNKEKENLANDTNWDELCELDPTVMGKIVDFLK